MNCLIAVLWAVLVSVSVLPSIALDIAVRDQFRGHAALSHLDLKYCGAFSHSQVSRGPLSCGYPAPGDHPWLVALGYSTPQDGVIYGCSGVLITDSLVLTSARCARGAEKFPLSRVRLGEYDLHAERDCLWYSQNVCQTASVRAVSATLVHPSFPKEAVYSHPNDVALVRLSQPVNITSHIQTVCLPLFANRAPPRVQMALSFGLQKTLTSIPSIDQEMECCSCSRQRNTSSMVMDEERLFLYDEEQNDEDTACYYSLMKSDGSVSCVGSGTPCISDTGAPYVGVDRYGGAFYVLGVTSTRPTPENCLTRPGTVNYAPVNENLPFILGAIEELSK